MYGILHVTQGPDQGQTLQVLPGRILTLGHGADGPGVLSDPHVSREHCQLLFDNGKVMLSDSGSASGTMVNGERVTELELQPGDVILIGQTHLEFQWTREDEKPTGDWERPKD
jgi:pSer/pThr/pTyr-binding forkhead associated (FHA) protein